jgi:hypothetical protein
MDVGQFERAVRLRLRHYTSRVLADRMTVARHKGGGGEGGGAADEDASAQLVVAPAPRPCIESSQS